MGQKNTLRQCFSTTECIRGRQKSCLQNVHTNGQSNRLQKKYIFLIFCSRAAGRKRGHQLSSHFLLRSSVWGNPVHNKSSRGRKRIRRRRRPVFSTEQNVNTRSPFPIIIIIVCSVVCSSEERLGKTLPTSTSQSAVVKKNKTISSKL